METRDDVRAEYTDLRAVFHGDLNEATVLQGALAAQGFETFIPSENMKVTDPFYTGANSLVVSLVAPAENCEAITVAIEEMRGAGELEAGETEAEEPVSRARLGWGLLFLFLVAVPGLFMAVALMRELFT